ncbi:MAG: outer rane lipid asymmetry maintenance protein MlaD [Pseudomonadota bacterium]
MSRATIDLWVGIFVTLGMAALVFLALKVGNLASIGNDPTYSVRAEFDNIGGLKVRAPVRSAGVVVGRVTDIQFDTKKYVAVVSLSLSQKYQFSKDTSAQILTSGLLGEQYLGLQAGGDEANLADGDTIKLTSSAVVLENLISRFMFNSAEKSGQNNEAKSGAN